MASEARTSTRADVARLFEPLTISGLTARNRLAVAPLTRVSATETGDPTARMADYYGAFAEGGSGLVVTEGIYTDQAWSQGYFYQPGLSNDAQRDAWKPVVERARCGRRRLRGRRAQLAGQGERLHA